MKGILNVKTGNYAISENISVTIAASDEGTVITTNFLLIKQHFSIVIDENGGVVRRHASQSYQQPPPRLVASATLHVSKPATPKPLPEPVGRRHAPKQIKFVIRYGQAYRPRNVAFVAGGFNGDGSTHILYRIKSGSTAVTQGQMHVHADGRVTLRNAIPPADVIAPEEWPAFLALPDNATFQLRKPWRKLPREDIGALVEGRVFTPTI